MYRLVADFVDPFLGCLVLLGLVLVSLWRGGHVPRGRLLLLTAAFAALTLACMPPIAFLAAGSLEWGYPPRYDLPDGTQAIVVLGGRVEPPDRVRTRAVLEKETTARCLKAAELYREAGPCLVAVSGGNVDPDQPGPTCGQAMVELLWQVGIARGDVVWEARSRTTHENAVEIRRLLAPRGIDRIVLVTTATHLARSARCFRQQGFQVTPRGCCYRATDFQWSMRSLLPNAAAADELGAVVHEWVGIAWYRLHGRI